MLARARTCSEPAAERAVRLRGRRRSPSSTRGAPVSWRSPMPLRR